MKRIALALCATIVSLSTTAQGTLLKRLQGNPKIDSLVSFVNEVMRERGNVYYHYDGKLHKTVLIGCTLMNDFQPTASTGNARVDSLNHVQDSIRQLRDEQGRRVYEAVRNTCKSLIDDAKESYVWEYHRGEVDSVRYAIAIGEYQNGDTMTTYRRNREVYYNRAPELISFHYNSVPGNDGSPWRFKGRGYFRYECTPDSVFKDKKDIVPLDKEAYTKLIQPILKQEGITSRQFYVYHDSTYTFEQKGTDEGDFVLRENTVEPKQPKSETKGTVYTMHSRAQADSVLSQIKKVTWTFLDRNTGFWFSFHPYTDYKNMGLSKLFESEYLTRVPDFYHIYIHSIGEEYNIVIVEGKGDMMIPMEWLILKSWKNGKVVYDKKAAKNLTPEEARENTSFSRSISTRQFEPFD